MDDFFALLGEERRPWLDLDALKSKYLQLTVKRHPDVAHGNGGGDFASINRAYQALSDPSARVRHLLEMETGAAPARTQEVPEEVAGFFGPVGLTRQRAEAFLKKRAAASTPVAQALLSAEQFQVQEEIAQVIADLEAARTLVMTELAGADRIWATNRRGALAMLPNIWQSLGYLEKWLAVLREDLFRFASL